MSAAEVRQRTLGAWMVVVDVWQGTLDVDGRGGGPVGNSSGRWMVVIAVRQRPLAVDGRDGVVPCRLFK